MIIVEIKGGLGNQMFQYALGYKLASMGKQIKYDISDYYRNGRNLRKLSLGIFDLELPVANENELIKVGRGNSLLGKACRKVGIGKDKIYIEDIDKGYQPSVFEMDNIYLSGYWQSEKYFKNICAEILKIYKMPGAVMRENKELLAEIENTNSVSMHIRRGDYLNEQNRKIYGNICTEKYYNEALNMINKRMQNSKIYVFTDDPKWARKKFAKKDFYVVEANLNRNDVNDLFLMSKCKANIIANSSFSWWAAWLNQNKNKIVVAPMKWFNNHETSEAICEDWNRIEG